MPTNTRKPRNRRDTRPRLSEAQLQAYRTRQAAAAQAAAEASVASKPGTSQASFSQWGRLDEEYAMIRSDLVRLGIITVAMFVIIVALTFVLR